MTATRRCLALAGALLLSGCLGGPTFKADHQERQAEQESFPGLRLSGTLDSDGDKVTVHAVARNEGRATFRVAALDCDPPWSQGMLGRFGSVYPLGQTGSCHATGTKDFPPGASWPYDLEWDGKLWDLQEERFREAPPGTYEWTLAFEAHAMCVGGSCEVNDWVRLRFTVEVE